MGLKLGQFYEGEVETFYDLVAVELMHHAIIVDKLIGIVLHKRLVDEVERIDGLQQFVLALLVQLSYEGFGGVEEDALLDFQTYGIVAEGRAD